MINYLIKYFSIIFCSFYTYARLINRPPRMKHILLWLPISLAVSIASYFVKLYIAPLNVAITAIAVFLFLLFSYRKSVNISATLSVLSLGMGLIFYSFSVFIGLPIYYVFFSFISDSYILETVAFSNKIIVHFICTYLFFKIKRFKKHLSVAAKKTGSLILIC